MPSTGAMIVIGVVFIVMFVYSLVLKPWYRPSSVWGSTPLGIRTGLISNAMMPFVYTLALKINPITWLTGLSHERLQLYHQWLARIALLFGVIHSIAFIYQPLKEGGYHNLVAWWKFSRQTWDSGAVALALMAWLVASSTRIFRNMSYEFFVAQHILSAIAFLGAYFWHTTDLIQSWSWLWPIVAIWGASAFMRIARAASASNFFMGTKTSIEVQQGSSQMVVGATNLEGQETPTTATTTTTPSSLFVGNGDVVRIALRTSVRWEPGQHVFVRFPTLAPTQSHPFTVINLPNPDSSRESILVLLARVRNGVTRKLLQRAQWQIQNGCCEKCPTYDADTHGCAGANRNPPSACCLPSINLSTTAINIPAIIDGPYGESASMASYDHVFMVAGGLGGTIALPILMDLAVRSRRGTSSTKCVRLLFSFKQHSLQSWFEEYLLVVRTLLEQAGVDFQVDFHCTASSLSAADDEKSAAGKVTPTLRGSSCCRADDIEAQTPSSEDEPEIKSAAASGIVERPNEEAVATRHRSSGKPTFSSSSSSSTSCADKNPNAASSASASVYIPTLPSPLSSRAQLPREIQQQAHLARDRHHKTMAVVVCGPQSMMDDTANAVAALQWSIFRGRMGQLRECYLLKEGFSW